MDKGNGEPDSAERKKEQVKQQKSIADLENQKNALRDALGSRARGQAQTERDRIAVSKTFQKKLKEGLFSKIFRRLQAFRRRWFLRLIELLKMLLPERLVSMIPKAQPAAREPVLSIEKPEQQQKPEALDKKPLLFSRAASFFRNAMRTKPRPDSINRSKASETPKRQSQWPPKPKPRSSRGSP